MQNKDNQSCRVQSYEMGGRTLNMGIILVNSNLQKNQRTCGRYPTNPGAREVFRSPSSNRSGLCYTCQDNYCKESCRAQKSEMNERTSTITMVQYFYSNFNYKKKSQQGHDMPQRFDESNCLDERVSFESYNEFYQMSSELA